MNATHTAETTPTTDDVARVHAHYRTIKKLGHWTTGRRFEVRARRGMVVLDLRSPQIPDGDIEVEVNLDHSMVKLLVPQDADIDHWDLSYPGRGRVKDWTGENGAGRRVRITGEIRHGEIRVHRGGIATLSAMFSREFVQDARRARREGTEPTVADPARGAN
ncbi:hypothetical protein ACFOY4_33050 [Actinomadura syzygii]|uniref:Uncharacterized protein n=1 Tax=Actinomadura syzygii TaxID=1427538 RepID=A0A5D0UBC8_9ACTN|nr:hypothetical protein [Actinomadura syzygii]TYC15090.1 hypothetical protein FXF65_13345 [Actinomadura syzygii]